MIDSVLTRRLILNNIEQSDAATLNQMRNDPGSRKYVPRKKCETLFETGELIARMLADNLRKAGINLAIRLRERRSLVGYVGIWRLDNTNAIGEIGFSVGVKYWRQGYMTEALTSFLDRIDVVFPITIQAFVHPDNEPSLRLLKRNDFTYLSPAETEPGFVVYHRDPEN